MASTRNKNTPGNYCMEQRQYRDTEQWRLYEHGAAGVATRTELAGNGLMPGAIPGRMLSSNSIDIEGFLFGINSTNLVTPEPPLVARVNRLDTLDLYTRAPVVMPTPLNVSPNQRPFPAP
jgi:hypothetical protein